MEKALIKTRYELRNGNSEKLILLKNLRTGFDVFDKLLPNMISIESLIILKGIVPIKVVYLINIRKYLFAFDKFYLLLPSTMRSIFCIKSSPMYPTTNKKTGVAIRTIEKSDGKNPRPNPIVANGIVPRMEKIWK